MGMKKLAFLVLLHDIREIPLDQMKTDFMTSFIGNGFYRGILVVMCPGYDIKYQESFVTTYTV